MQRYLDMVWIMLTTGPLMLPMCRSVLIESGGKPSCRAGIGVAEPETARAVPQVKDHAPLARLPEMVVDPSVLVDDGELAGKDVGVNVARAQLFQDQSG